MRKAAPPPPFMIFCSKLDVCHNNRDKSSCNQKENEHNEKNAIYCVYPVTPNTCKYISKITDTANICVPQPSAEESKYLNFGYRKTSPFKF
ncbi:hypothetical protein H5410_031662 [Solanum commersonii]|uniref:Uncharacterized protein n=1 Tax=Solanum commersonii TaxID=4109 RepID=A0A9J5YMD6_SOLCO|nr:hypothetical protein H5410_031662 [Solanum commersonii]